MGKARSPTLGSRAWCRRFAVFASVALIGACGSDDATQQAAPRDLVRPTRGDAAPEPAPRPQQARYYDAYLAEILDGDAPRASEAYRQVMDLADSREATLAARAALRLAQLETLQGNRREAVELVARAVALGGQDPDVVEQADALQDELGAVQATGTDVRGPPLGTELTGVSDEAKAKFGKAEKLSRGYYQDSTRPRIEDPQAGARARQRAAELAERAYGAVIDLGEPAAAVAAEFRIGSLYHDLAVSLVSEQPPELERRALGRLRRQQNSRAARYYRTARAAYRRSLAFGQDDSSDRWRREAQKGLESVEVLLRGSD